jgi:hypothetical protein
MNYPKSPRLPGLRYLQMRRCFPIAALATTLLGGAAPSFAHHSFAAEFDGTKPVTLKGKVTEFEWVNPHSWVHIDVIDDNGNTVNWACETAPRTCFTEPGGVATVSKSGMRLSSRAFAPKTGLTP